MTVDNKRAYTALGRGGMCYSDPGMFALKARGLVLLRCRFFSLQQHHLFLSSAPSGFISALLIRVSTSRLGAALTYMQVFLSYTMSKADTDVLLGSFPSQSALQVPRNPNVYYQACVGSSLFFFLASKEAWDTWDALCPRGLQDLGLQKVFLGYTLPSSSPLPPWALCPCWISPEYFACLCSWQQGWTCCSVIALWFMLHFLKRK